MTKMEASHDLVERLRQEARIHAQEALAANATIAEIYQICTGSTGEPGNWNGAEPVRQLAEQRAELLDQLKVAAALLHGMPKSLGYDHDARGFEAVIARISNATQQRNATGGEG